MIGEGKTRGQVAILDIEACNNQNSAAIRINPCVANPEFVYRYLEGRYLETRRTSSGNNQPALNRSRVQAIPIAVPPIAEQHAIVQELDATLSIIDGLARQAATALGRSKRVRAAILARAFSGQLVPQDRNDEPASVLLERIRAGRAAVPISQRRRKASASRA
jgi:type I restriction enzyme S subunit